MAKSKLVKVNEKIAQKVTAGYRKMEHGVVGGYQAVEQAAVQGFGKLTDAFVEEFLTRDGESVQEAKQRLAQEDAQRRSEK